MIVRMRSAIAFSFAEKNRAKIERFDEMGSRLACTLGPQPILIALPNITPRTAGIRL
jgi:hypothetical protein